TKIDNCNNSQPKKGGKGDELRGRAPLTGVTLVAKPSVKSTAFAIKEDSSGLSPCCYFIHSHPKGREFVFHAANSHDLANWMWLLKARIEKGKGTIPNPFSLYIHKVAINNRTRIVQKSWCHQETTIQRGKTNGHLIFYLSF